MKKLGKVIDWSDKWELITAARLDYHDQLQEEGLQFGPKIGLMYNPNPKHSFRLTFGRAFNTPTTTSLFTNYYVQDFSIFNVYLRGNKDGTQYVESMRIQMYPNQYIMMLKEMLLYMEAMILM